MMNVYPESWVSLDLETTGLNPRTDRIIEIGIVVVRPGVPIVVDSVLVRPETSGALPEVITTITGLKRKDLDAGVSIMEALLWLSPRIHGLPLVGHNALAFDVPFLRAECERCDSMALWGEVYDTAGLYIAAATGQRQRRHDESLAAFSARMIGRGYNHQKYNLALACREMGVSLEGVTAHRAAGDALAAYRLFEACRAAGVGMETTKPEGVRL